MVNEIPNPRPVPLYAILKKLDVQCTETKKLLTIKVSHMFDMLLETQIDLLLSQAKNSKSGRIIDGEKWIPINVLNKNMFKIIQTDMQKNIKSQTEQLVDLLHKHIVQDQKGTSSLIHDPVGADGHADSRVSENRKQTEMTNSLAPSSSGFSQGNTLADQNQIGLSSPTSSPQSLADLIGSQINDDEMSSSSSILSSWDDYICEHDDCDHCFSLKANLREAAEKAEIIKPNSLEIIETIKSLNEQSRDLLQQENVLSQQNSFPAIINDLSIQASANHCQPMSVVQPTASASFPLIPCVSVAQPEKLKIPVIRITRLNSKDQIPIIQIVQDNAEKATSNLDEVDSSSDSVLKSTNKIQDSYSGSGTIATGVKILNATVPFSAPLVPFSKQAQTCHPLGSVGLIHTPELNANDDCNSGTNATSIDDAVVDSNVDSASLISSAGIMDLNSMAEIFQFTNNVDAQKNSSQLCSSPNQTEPKLLFDSINHSNEYANLKLSISNQVQPESSESTENFNNEVNKIESVPNICKLEDKEDQIQNVCPNVLNSLSISDSSGDEEMKLFIEKIGKRVKEERNITDTLYRAALPFGWPLPMHALNVESKTVTDSIDDEPSEGPLNTAPKASSSYNKRPILTQMLQEMEKAERQKKKVRFSV